MIVINLVYEDCVTQRVVCQVRVDYANQRHVCHVNIAYFCMYYRGKI